MNDTALNDDENLTPIASEMATSTSTPSQHSDRKPEPNDLEQSDPKSIDLLLWEEERTVREQVAKSPFTGNFLGAFLVNIYSAIHIVTVYLISLESIISITLSVSLTVFTYNCSERGNPSYNGSAMDWVLLSFAVITPMSASISMAFTRREQALQHLASVKTTLWNIYSAHACWDWSKPGKPETGRAGCDIDWQEHGDRVLLAIIQLTQDLTRMLTLPNSSRARHRVTPCGEEESHKIMNVRLQLHRSIYRRVNDLTSLCEIFKLQGLPPNEATRVRQWERNVTERIELLEMIKKYRTPQALRSFARLFSFLLPPFYAPYYGQMASDLNSLGVGIVFSILTCIALTSLFESVSQIEDPFVGLYVLDGIHVRKELGDHLWAELLECRKHHFPNAGPFQKTCPGWTPIPQESSNMRFFQSTET